MGCEINRGKAFANRTGPRVFCSATCWPELFPYEISDVGVLSPGEMSMSCVACAFSSGCFREDLESLPGTSLSSRLLLLLQCRLPVALSRVPSLLLLLFAARELECFSCPMEDTPEVNSFVSLLMDLDRVTYAYRSGCSTDPSLDLGLVLVLYS